MHLKGENGVFLVFSAALTDGVISVGNITFSQIQVEVNGNPVVPTWVPMTQTPYCNEHAVVKNSTDVVICF